MLHYIAETSFQYLLDKPLMMMNDGYYCDMIDMKDTC